MNIFQAVETYFLKGFDHPVSVVFEMLRCHWSSQASENVLRASFSIDSSLVVNCFLTLSPLLTLNVVLLNAFLTLNAVLLNALLLNLLLTTFLLTMISAMKSRLVIDLRLLDLRRLDRRELHLWFNQHMILESRALEKTAFQDLLVHLDLVFENSSYSASLASD